MVKANGGAASLTDDKDKLRQQAVYASETTKLVGETEDTSVLRKIDSIEFHRQEEILQFQKLFKVHYNIPVNKLEKLGNPFLCNSVENDIIQLDTRNFVGKRVVKFISEVQEMRILQAETLISERIMTKSYPIHAQSKRFSMLSAANTLSIQTTSRKEL